MIDADKYEGHTEGKWNITMDDTMEGYYFFRQGYDREQEEDCDYDECRANARLMSDAPLLLAEVKRLREELNRAYDTIQEYEEVIEPKRLNKIERLEKALKSNGRYNAIVDATGNAGRGSIMVDVTFDDGEEYYGILDKVIE